MSRNRKDPLQQFHSASNRHVLVVETDMGLKYASNVVHTSKLLRFASNHLIAEMRKRLDQLLRLKRYKLLLDKYDKVRENKAKRQKIGNKLNQLQKQMNVAWDYCRRKMIEINKIYKVNSQLALSQAENIWFGIEKILYDKGKVLHFKRYNELPALIGKQINRCIILKIEDGKLVGYYDKMKFGFIEKDNFERNELNAIKNYMENSIEIDSDAVCKYVKTKELTDTFRPCYITLVPEYIRGLIRVFAHITIEGKALPKERKREIAESGRIGIDIGTQTIAYTSNTEVGLKNLSERGMAIKKGELKEKKLQRYMDKSRRLMNPDNYNENGTIKKGKHKWIKSNRYKKAEIELRELRRKNAINRKLACNEDVWHLRSLGNTIITEKMSWKGLQKRGKKKKNKDGKEQRRKRFGKSIQNRCPGYFQSKLKSVFESTGGKYIEVPYNYRASQYDHTEDVYIKKKLNQRMYYLRDGTLVQRDWYSSYLLYCFNLKKKRLNKKRCRLRFKDKLKMINNHIEYIKANGIKVLNSGIKTV